MTHRIFAIVLVASTSVFAPRIINAEQNVEHSAFDLAVLEYQTCLAEFRLDTATVNVVLQANDRLLRLALTSERTDAGFDYDQRAKQIETIAQQGFERGTVCMQELAQAKAARVDSLLKKHLFEG